MMDSVEMNDNSEEVIKHVKARLLEEGREARNLVAYSVPIHQHKSPSAFENTSKLVLPRNDQRKLSSNAHKQDKRHRSASAGRTPQANLRARHWGFLFRNLEQAVDEIYQTCEDDESIIECKEAILMLERYTNDFRKLIEWLKLKWEFEKTPPPNRPASVSWEIRTSSSRYLASRGKYQLPLDANQTGEVVISNLTKENVESQNKNELNRCIINLDNDIKSPISKLSTVIENEIVDKIVDKDEISSCPPYMSNDSNLMCVGKNNVNIDRTEKHEGEKQIKQSTGKLVECMENTEKNSEQVEAKNGENGICQREPKKFATNERVMYPKAGSPKVISTSKDVKSNKIFKIESTKKLTGRTAPLKDDVKLFALTPVRSKSTTNLKTVTNPKLEVDQKKIDQQKLILPLTGPTVNMNKASQVRQAYNQNKAPQKSSRPVTWNNFVTNHGNEAGFASIRQCQSSKLPLNRNSYASASGKSQKKNWISYTRNNEPMQNSRGLVRSVTSLAESHITRKAITDGNADTSFHAYNDCSPLSTSSSGLSWADKVKGGRTASTMALKSDVEDDTEGWEVVRRGRRTESTSSLNSPFKKNVSNNTKAAAFTLKMQKRYNQPTSAVSLPSLINKTPSREIRTDESHNANQISSVKDDCAKKEQRRKHTRQQDVHGSLNKSEKNKCNNLRREECKATEAKVLNGNKIHKTSTDTNTSFKAERRVSEACISVSENTSDSEREEEEMTKNEALFATAIKEEKRLKKEIEETENNSIEIFADEEVDSSSNDISTVHGDETPQNVNADWSLEPPQNTYPIFQTPSWADMGPIDNLRQPGRVLHIHEKLSSPARRLTSSEKLQKHQQKLAKAEELRGKVILEKTEKLKDLFRKIGDVNVDKERLLLEKRHLFEKKMARAEDTRKKYLQQIVNKAHDEDTKAREIAFINDLEAQNKLHDIMQQQQCHESRLADMAEERSRKLEEKAAKEAAAQERRKTIEAERQARMVALCEKRRRRCEKIDRQQAERREELLEQAREKAREREERLSALQQAQQAKESELVKKIQQKQEETARRHDENIELIRQRALESSITRCSRGCDDTPKLLRYEIKKLCTLCNSLIASEVYLISHLKGRKHQDALRELYKDEASNEQTAKYNLIHIVDAPDNIDELEVSRDQERQKSLKKKCRKIKSRMVARGNQFLHDFKYPFATDSKFKTRISKDLHLISKLILSQGSGPWPARDVSTLDKNLLDLHRVISNGSKTEATVFLFFEGFVKINEVMDVITNTDENLPCVLPPKSLLNAVRVMHAACLKLFDNCEYILQSRFIVNAIDQLSKRMTVLADDIVNNVASRSTVELTSDPVCTGLMEFIGYILEAVLINETNKTGTTAMDVRIKEVVSYCVSVGVVNKLTWYFNRVQGPVDNDQSSTDFLLASMKILSSLTSCLARVPHVNDPTQLIYTIQMTDFYGIASLLYGMLLQEAGRSLLPPSDYLSPSTLAITNAGTNLLCNLAELDLKLFQSILGSEGISLELRHICSFLIWYCSHWPNIGETILHNVIILVGFFTVNNKENQSIIQSGETPSVLQQLCNLPWNYFTDTRLTSVLFPSLLASCLDNEDNRRIVEQDMSFQILKDFLTKKESPGRPLVKILHKMYMK